MAHDLVTELLQYSSLACFMPIWQLCANLLIPNCLRSNLSYSLLAALELYVKNPNSVLITFIIFVYYMETIDCFFCHDAAYFAKIRNFLYGCKSKIYFVCHILK